MKINNSQPPTPLTAGAPGAAARTAPEASAADGDKPASTSISSSIASLHAKLADETQDIDAARVEEARQAIINGEMKIDVGKIADGLLENLRGR